MLSVLKSKAIATGPRAVEENFWWTEWEEKRIW